MVESPSPGRSIGLPVLGTARSCMHKPGSGGCSEVGPRLERAGSISADEDHCPEIKCFSLVFPFGLAKLYLYPDPCTTSEYHPTLHPPLDPTSDLHAWPPGTPACLLHRPGPITLPCAGRGNGHGISCGIGQARLAGSIGFLFLLLYWPCPSSAMGCWRGAGAGLGNEAGSQR